MPLPGHRQAIAMPNVLIGRNRGIFYAPPETWRVRSRRAEQRVLFETRDGYR